MSSSTKFNQRYDTTSKLMYVNDISSVMHCHHYTTNFIKVALDFEDLSGIENMINAAEDAFFLAFKKYFISEHVVSTIDRIKICTDLYAYTGMGVMNIVNCKGDSGDIELLHSHVDEGWLKKFGKIDRPINFITQGYIKAMFSTVFDEKIRSYKVDEIESIVLGSKKSHFKVNKNEG